MSCVVMQAAVWLFSAIDRMLMLLHYARFDWYSIVGTIMYPRNINSKFTKQICTIYCSRQGMQFYFGQIQTFQNIHF